MLYIFWKILWNIFGKEKAITKIKEMDVFLSSNIPFCAQGVFTGLRGAFVKRVYYTNSGQPTETEAISDTEKVKLHEYNHYLQRKRLGFIGFWSTIIWAYICFWKSHDNKPLEREAAENEKRGING
jgi:hypothetical protein